MITDMFLAIGCILAIGVLFNLLLVYVSRIK